MWNVGQIVEGTVKNILDINTELSDERMKICKECPLYIPFMGGQCNSKGWLNPNTNEVSTVAKEGYYKGCGCILKSKTKAKYAECPAGKW